MTQKNENLKIPYSITLITLFIAFFGSYMILEATNAFGTANPQDAPEKVLYYWGLLGYALISAIIISLLMLLTLSQFYELSKQLYIISIGIIGVVGLLVSIVMGKIIFDVTNFFILFDLPVLIQITNECSIDKSCIKEINGLTYSLILGPIIALILMAGSFFSFKKSHKI